MQIPRIRRKRGTMSRSKLIASIKILLLLYSFSVLIESSQFLHIFAITVLLRNLTRRTILFNFAAALLIIQFQRSSNFSPSKIARVYSSVPAYEAQFSYVGTWVYIWTRISGGLRSRSSRIRESRVRNSACSGYDLRAIILLPARPHRVA